MSTEVIAGAQTAKTALHTGKFIYLILGENICSIQNFSGRNKQKHRRHWFQTQAWNEQAFVPGWDEALWQLAPGGGRKLKKPCPCRQHSAQLLDHCNQLQESHWSLPLSQSLLAGRLQRTYTFQKQHLSIHSLIYSRCFFPYEGNAQSWVASCFRSGFCGQHTNNTLSWLACMLILILTMPGQI